MKTAKVNRDELRESTLTIPMSKEEKKAVQKISDRMGISMSAFTRMLIREHLEKVNN